VDPLCEKYYSISPYAYCAGNPVNRIDPDGMYYYDWNTKEYKTDAGNVVSWDEVKGNNFQEPPKELIGMTLNSNELSVDNFFEKTDPNSPIWKGIKQNRLEEIKTKKIDVGSQWIDGMPTVIQKNDKILVVSSKTGKYVDIMNKTLVREFDATYSNLNFPNEFSSKRMSVVGDNRFIEGLLASFASAANPISIPVYGWTVGVAEDGINYYNDVATPQLQLKRLNYYKKYGIIK